MNAGKRAEVLREAWIGDAVLALFARRWILAQTGFIDGQCAARMTSNQFLNTLGAADEVEARIGRVYESEGLDAAFRWIEAELMPRFLKQESNREKRRAPLRQPGSGPPGVVKTHPDTGKRTS